MNKKYIVKLDEKYEELSDQIKHAWEQIIGWGCGYFDSWSILSDQTIRVRYERPRNGGLDFDDIDIDDILKIINK
jgi:hypothetical protein